MSDWEFLSVESNCHYIRLHDVREKMAMELRDWIQIVFLSPLVPLFVDRLHECRMPPQ